LLRLDASNNQRGVNEVRVCPKGPSAGQSTFFVLVDLILGVRHARTHHRESSPSQKEKHTKAAAASGRSDGADGGGGAAAAAGDDSAADAGGAVMPAFQSEMLDYMPRQHAQLVKSDREASQLTQYLKNNNRKNMRFCRIC
jgi:hypothetical protein